MTTAVPEIGKAVNAAGVTTNYHEAGHGETVILIHGSGPGVSAWANWQGTIPYLAERLHVLAYDQIGFGCTDLPQNPSYGLDTWTGHLFGFMDALGVDRAHLIGNSMGAAVAIAAAATRPDRVDRLVTMGAMDVRFPITEGLEAVWGYSPSFENMKRVIGVFAYNNDLMTDQLVQMRYEASVRPGSIQLSEIFQAPRQHWVEELARYENRLPDIDHPALVVHGREDRVIPLSTSLRLMEELPDAQLHIFSRCGHWTQIEHAAEFNRLARDFLTS